MSEIINNNDSYIVRTNGRIYVKLGGRYIALIDEDGNLNVKLKTSISTVSNFNNINSEGLYYYNGNIYAYANGSPYLLTGGGGSGDVINQVLSGDLRAVTSNAVYVTTENIKNNLANKVLPFEEFKMISSVVYNPTDITEGRVLYSLNLKCFILENTVGGRTTYYTNWKGSEKYQTIDSENVSQITLKPDVLYLFTNLSIGQASVRTLYMAKSNGDLTRILTDRDLNDVLTLDDVDTEITSSSSKPVTSSAIYTALSKLGSIEYFDGTLSAEETINIIDSATTANDILILYSYKYKTFVAKYNNNYYKRWNTADKFFDGTTPNKHILFVCDDTLYFWNNDLVTVNVDNIDDCIIYIDLYMRGGLLPTPSASDLGKYAIVESNTYQLYRAEQFNNVISYTAKSFSKNRLYINDNKLYLWNGSELVQVGISEFNLLIAPFDGVINSATVQESSYTGTGDVFYITSLQRFAFRVISLNQTKYYDNWSDSGLYFGENRKPRKDTIYVNNGVGYVFDGTNGLIAIGGSAPSGPDSQQTVDQSLSTTSTNAVANKAVTAELNTLSGRVTTMEQSGVPSEVTADEVTVSAKNASGGNAAIHLASNPKSTVNSVGAIHVTDSTLPSNVSQNTKYIIYKDITTGNVTGLNYIQLAPGTKIVPNGGIPKVPVVGGEMSWVHSSDIGMVQDDGTHNKTIGLKNFEIFEKFVECNYNLELDGDYYLYKNGYGNPNLCILLNRELKIRGGRLFVNDYFITINKGASFIAENVTFEKVPNAWGYEPIYLNPTDGLINNVEFLNCNFVGNKKTNVRFIGQRTLDVAPSDMEVYKKWSEDTLSALGYSAIILNTSGDTIYAFNSPYSVQTIEKTDPDTQEVTTSKVLVDRNNKEVAESTWENIAKELHPFRADMPVENTDGNIIFVVTGTTSKAKGDYSEICNGKYGYYILTSEASQEELGKTDGKKYSYLDDSSVLKVEAMGLKVFRMINCSCTVRFNLGDMMIRDRFEVFNSTFNLLRVTEFNIGSTNTKPYANDWVRKSCVLKFENCEFNGPSNEVIKPGDSYVCGILAEGNSAHIKNCRFTNFMANLWAIYECYLSTGEVVFENNYIFNVFAVPNNRESENKGKYYMPLTEWMKSKGAPVVGNRLPTRIYRNNWYEVDYDLAWKACKSYMESTYNEEGDNPLEIFDTYAMNTHMFAFISTAIMDKVLVEGNTFKFKKGVLSQNTLTGRTSYIKNTIIKNNTFEFKSYPTKYNRPFLAVRYNKNLDHPNVEISGNTFISEEPQTIQMLTGEVEEFGDIRIQNNTFINSNFRLTCDVIGRSLLKAEKVNIINNNYVSKNIIPSASISSVFNERTGGVTVKPDPFRVIGLELHNIEMYDIQTKEQNAGASKEFEIPNVGYVTITSPLINRPISIDDTTGFPIPSEDLSLIFYKAAKQSLSSNWDVNISYTFGGKLIHRRMEISLRSANNYRSLVVRDVNGLIRGKYFSPKEAWEFSSLPDIGLGFLIEGSGISNSLYIGDIALHIYSLYEGGTKNDKNTEIKITIRAENERGIFSANEDPNYTNFTPIKEFVPSGSEVTQQWLDAIAEGFSWDGSKSPRTGPYMREADTGLRVHVGSLWYTWNGTQWVPDKIIVSLTLAAYDALTTKDENTLYLIVDA